MGYLWADVMTPAFWVAVGQIIWINILLSGDNAVVIALACRSLPPRQRFWGILLGAGAAVLLRIFFTIIIAQIMGVPFLKLVGGLLLLWIAVKLIVPSDEHGEDSVKAGDTLLARGLAGDRRRHRDEPRQRHRDRGGGRDRGRARRPGACAQHQDDPDRLRPCDLSVPLIIAGSTLLMALLNRFPILVWAGAGLLGWVAGEIMIKDAAVVGWMGQAFVDKWHLWAAAAGVVFVIALGWIIRKTKHKKRAGAAADRRSAGTRGVPQPPALRAA